MAVLIGCRNPPIGPVAASLACELVFGSTWRESMGAGSALRARLRRRGDRIRVHAAARENHRRRLSADSAGGAGGVSPAGSWFPLSAALPRLDVEASQGIPRADTRTPCNTRPCPSEERGPLGARRPDLCPVPITPSGHLLFRLCDAIALPFLRAIEIVGCGREIDGSSTRDRSFWEGDSSSHRLSCAPVRW